MPPATYGLKLLATLLLFCLLWYIIAGDKLYVFVPATLLIIILAMRFIPLIYIDDQIIRLRSLHPFSRKKGLYFRDIERMHIYTGKVLFRIEFHLKDGTQHTSNSYFRYNDLKRVYQHLDSLGVHVVVGSK
jgi:hypothetical protein